MDIKTKFNLGQKVFYLKNICTSIMIESQEIWSIGYKATRGERGEVYEIEVLYLVNGEVIDAGLCFATIEEAEQRLKEITNED